MRWRRTPKQTAFPERNGSRMRSQSSKRPQESARRPPEAPRERPRCRQDPPRDVKSASLEAPGALQEDPGEASRAPGRLQKGPIWTPQPRGPPGALRGPGRAPPEASKTRKSCKNTIKHNKIHGFASGNHVFARFGCVLGVKSVAKLSENVILRAKTTYFTRVFH